MKKSYLAAIMLCALTASASAFARDIGAVSTTFRLLGAANDKIKIEAFADPKIDGITCYISRAVTGGISGAIGLAEDTSDAAIECVQTGPILFGRGVDIHVAIDQSKFGGSSPWLFGAVLERFLSRHVSINCATRFKMDTLQHGAFATWPPRMGMRPNA